MHTMGRHTILLVILLCYRLLFVVRVHCSEDISTENELDRAIHLNLLNKPSTKALKKTTEDFIAERQILEVNNTEVANRANTYLAVARTKLGPNRYSGGICYIKLENPRVVGQQYSATRIRVQGGNDSIEAGWRVDPSLFGDNKTRLFIRTDAGETHCFNNYCPGFVEVYRGYGVGLVFNGISIPGGKIYVMRFEIVRDSSNGNWNFLMGDDSILIGYWPSHIFTGLNGLADRVEWGGVAYSPPGTPLPPMGSGNHPVGASEWDGFIAQMKIVNETGQVIDASDTEIYEDNSKLYSVQYIGYYNKQYGQTIFYGGSGH